MWGGLFACFVVVPKHLFALVFSLCSTLPSEALTLLPLWLPCFIAFYPVAPKTSMLNLFLSSRLGWFLVSHHETFSCLYGWSLFIQSIWFTFYYIPKEL